MENKTTIFLVPAEVQQFMLFQQYYQIFTILVDNKVFEQKKATVSLNFDHDGVLKSIQRSDFLYSQKFS